MLRPLRRGSRDASVRALQQALNARASTRDLPQVAVDGHLGPATLASVQRVARALGALEATLRAARATGIVSVGLQRIVRFPGERTPKQTARARARAEAAAKASARRTGPEAALTEARRQIGVTEAGDRARVLRWIEACLGITYRVPWCGVFCHHCLTVAKVPNLTGRMAGVVLILDDALRSRNGLQGVVYRRATGTGSVTAGRPGDLVGLFGESTHVELVERRVPGGYQTIGGNTSSGRSGSQANGRGVYRRVRPDSAVVYLVRPDYPNGAPS